VLARMLADAGMACCADQGAGTLTVHERLDR
jgi:hypothetical protein